MVLFVPGFKRTPKRPFGSDTPTVQVRVGEVEGPGYRKRKHAWADLPVALVSVTAKSFFV